MINWWFGAVMTSNNSSTWRCLNKPRDRSREEADGRWDKRREKKRNRKRKEKEEQEEPEMAYMQCRGPWNKSHTLPCLYPELRLTLGVGNLTILSLSPSSLSQIACPWYGLLRLYVCFWLLCLPFTSLGHWLSVLPQPSSSSTHFPWASSNRPLPPSPTSLTGSTHRPLLLAHPSLQP